MANIKIRVNPVTREIEIDVPENRFEEFSEYIMPSLRKVSQEIKNTQLPAVTLRDKNQNASIGKANLPDTFGEYLTLIQTEKDVDRVLAAGYFIQSNSESNNFTNHEVTTMLKDHGYSLSNPSAFINSLRDSKRIFKVDGKWRVSALGKNSLDTITNNLTSQN